MIGHLSGEIEAVFDSFARSRRRVGALWLGFQRRHVTSTGDVAAIFTAGPKILLLRM